jgi:hypothetical protein
VTYRAGPFGRDGFPVRAASTVPFVTSLTVNPGGAIIAVDVKANPDAGDLSPRRTAVAATAPTFPHPRRDGHSTILAPGRR